MQIAEMVHAAHDNSKRKGWWIGIEIPADTIPEKLALIHSEVSEALECYRERRLVTEVSPEGKPEGLPSELADVLIRIADLCGALEIDLAAEVELKMAYNKTRAFRHGNKAC